MNEVKGTGIPDVSGKNYSSKIRETSVFTFTATVQNGTEQLNMILFEKEVKVELVLKCSKVGWSLRVHSTKNKKIMSHFVESSLAL